MRLSANELAREAAATGFQTEPLEKVILLLELLEAIRSHPFLKDRVALKGGTALNLFKFDVPRLRSGHERSCPTATNYWRWFSH